MYIFSSVKYPNADVHCSRLRSVLWPRVHGDITIIKNDEPLPESLIRYRFGKVYQVKCGEDGNGQSGRTISMESPISSNFPATVAELNIDTKTKQPFQKQSSYQWRALEGAAFETPATLWNSLISKKTGPLLVSHQPGVLYRWELEKALIGRLQGPSRNV